MTCTKIGTWFRYTSTRCDFVPLYVFTNSPYYMPPCVNCVYRMHFLSLHHSSTICPCCVIPFVSSPWFASFNLSNFLAPQELISATKFCLLCGSRLLPLQQTEWRRNKESWWNGKLLASLTVQMLLFNTYLVCFKIFVFRGFPSLRSKRFFRFLRTEWVIRWRHISRQVEWAGIERLGTRLRRCVHRRLCCSKISCFVTVLF